MLNVMYFPAEKNGKNIGDGVVECKNKNTPCSDIFLLRWQLSPNFKLQIQCNP